MDLCPHQRGGRREMPTGSHGELDRTSDAVTKDADHVQQDVVTAVELRDSGR